MMVIQVLKIFIPNRFTSSKVLHRTIYWGLRTFVRPDANYLILRHFHIGSEILQFVATNVPGVSIPLNPLRPRDLRGLIDDVFLKHDLNIYNFLIRLNREMKAQGIALAKQERLNFDCITDGPFDIDADNLPDGRLNLIDLETAIELYTPLYQLFLTDSDFWRACNSLQLDETVAIYTSRLDAQPASALMATRATTITAPVPANLRPARPRSTSSWSWSSPKGSSGLVATPAFLAKKRAPTVSEERAPMRPLASFQDAAFPIGRMVEETSGLSS